MESNKVNIIVTAIVLAVILAIGIISGVSFKSFYNYQPEFVVRTPEEGVYMETMQMSQFSPSLKGTVGDATIYVQRGLFNTVAVVKADQKASFATADAFTVDKIVGDSYQFNGGNNSGTEYPGADPKAFNTAVPTALVEGAAEAIAQVKGGSKSAAYVAYKDAMEAVAADSSLAIADFTVERVPSLLVLGGTHPAEPAGQIGAVMMLEAATVRRGVLYVIPETNRSAYSQSQPLEGSPQYYELGTVGGKTRTFKFGARMSNAVSQWPTPDMFVNDAGQMLSSSEVRNINRSYPGSVDGTFTERVAYAVVNLIRTFDITMEIDMHEAGPTYPTTNSIVYHNDSTLDPVVLGMTLEEAGITVTPDASPRGMTGLTHREIGDHTNAYAFLFETTHAGEGLVHGVFNTNLVYYGDNGTAKDKYTEYLTEIGSPYIFGEAEPLSGRVARQVWQTHSIVTAFNSEPYARYVYEYSDLPVEERHCSDNQKHDYLYLGEMLLDTPDYYDIVDNGVEAYLLDPRG